MVHIVDNQKSRPREDDRLVGGAQAISRAVLVLRLLARNASQGRALSELVTESGLAKPTCRRMLLALIEAGFAEQDAQTRRYFLGPESYLLGVAAGDRFGMHRLAQESVVRLAQKTGDAAFFQARRDYTVVCLQREDGDYPIRSHVLAPGERHPLGVGGGGLAILAALDDDEVEAAMRANAELFALRYPQLSESDIRQGVAEARRQGYSMNRGVLFPGSWGMGVAVRDAQGRVEACLSLATVESRMQGQREAELARLLLEEAKVLEQKLRVPARQTSTERAAAPQRRMRRQA